MNKQTVLVSVSEEAIEFEDQEWVPPAFPEWGVSSVGMPENQAEQKEKNERFRKALDS